MMSLSFDGPVATLSLNRPPVNAINEQWLDQLDGALEEIKNKNEIILMRIRSEQNIFCAGADLELMNSLIGSEEGRETMIAFVRRIQRIYLRLENLPAVTLAEISGAAMGGGLELALACDLRVVADTAMVGLPEASIGLLPGAGGTQRMTRICGEAVARRLILGAEIIDGKTAQELHLAQWSIPLAEIETFTDALVEKIARLSGPALAACKACIAGAKDPSQDGYELEIEGTRQLFANDDTRLRVNRFLGGHNK